MVVKKSSKVLKLSLNSLLLSSSLILSGCGGGGGSSSPTNDSVQNDTTQKAPDKTADSSNITNENTAKNQDENKVSENTAPQTEEQKDEKIVGYLIDSPVIGAKYSCGGKSSYTGAGGEFKCSSLPVTFAVGDAVFGEADELPDDKKLFIQDLVGVDRKSINNKEVLKIALFLQSLDEDGDLSEINIPKSVHVAFDEKIDFKNRKLESLKSELKEKYPDIKLAKEEDVLKHLKESVGLEDEDTKEQDVTLVKKDEEEQKKAEEARRAEEEQKKAEEAKKAEEEQKKKAEEARRVEEEQKKAEEEQKKAEEARRAEEERKKAEKARRAEEEQKKAEEARRAEEERKKAEEARRAEEEKEIDNTVPYNPSSQSKLNVKTYDYIPKGDKLTDAMAIRFLSKAGFGANQEDVKSLRDKGVEVWVEEQLNMPLKENQYLIKTIEISKEAIPDQNPNTVEEYLADNDIVFNKQYASFFSRRFMESAWFDIAVTSKDQLRQKVAYALSQIIVESDFEPIFIRRGEALSRYFDILAKNALGNYKQLLTDISFNSGMSLFLTFNGSKKLHENEAGVKVYPDENYAREIMQLFSIGLNELNMDGTPKKDSNGNLIPTYTQEDVNELSRVFTGWDLKRNGRYGLVGFTRGDFTHPVEFTADYHDFGEKKLLGQTIPAGLAGEEDVKAAIDIIMSNQNVAPYISKNLIMRLTKSNPSPSYVQRVATVFADSNGDLKKVVRAILLDEEIWDDIKNLKTVKFKEPIIAYVSSLKAMNVKPLPYWYFCKFGGPDDDEASNCTRVHNKFLFNDPRSYLGQGAGLAPTVFNFYDNSFVPNSAEFKGTPPTYAPEVQIQDDTILIKFSNAVRNIFNWEEIRMTKGSTTTKTMDEVLAGAPAAKSIPFYYIGADKFYFNLKEDYDFLEERIDGNTDGDFKELKDDYQKGDIAKINQAVKEYIDFVDNKLTGGLLKEDEKEVIYQELTNDEKGFYNHWAGDDSSNAKIRQIMDRVIKPLYRAIITSDKFMTE